MTYSDPVYAGLIEGLKPGRTRTLDAGDTLTLKPKLLRAAERLRIVRAVERQAELSESILAAHLRIADAVERQADALELIGGLFASTIGVGTAACGANGPDPTTYQTVNFVRTGLGRKDFVCDGDSFENAKDD
ncbi:hypothetical protein [Bradyrhizobium sp. STM 3566]|uniref:hypothetical protein n=1 Tax=Bradyrhizobium sp. STM 3566 TaxID=578928 RepID=UPI00388F8490